MFIMTTQRVTKIERMKPAYDQPQKDAGFVVDTKNIYYRWRCEERTEND